MSAPQSQTQWYLARDGKQYGPLTDPELAKFIELGHLLPSDLLWREGFAEWRPAPSVFQLDGGGAQSAAAVPAHEPEPEAYAAEPAASQAHSSPAYQHGAAEAGDHHDHHDHHQQQRTAAPGGGEEAAYAQPGAQAPQHVSHPHAHPSAHPAGNPQAGRLQRGYGQAAQAYDPRLQGAQRQPQQVQPQQRQALRAQQGRPQGDLQLGVPQGGRRINPAEFDEDTDFEPGGKVLRKIFVALALLAVLAAVGYGAFTYRGQLAGIASSDSKQEAKSAAPPVVASDRKTLDVPPLKSLTGDAAQVDEVMQRAALWRVLKREFPDWYAERTKAIAELSAQSVDPREIAQKTAQSLVQLRRQNLAQALSASVPRLRLIASTFFENLSELRKSSDVACFEFIARGESSPLVVTMLQGSAHVTRLQSQMTAVYEAIADGRSTPRAYPNPKREDYEKLAGDLQKNFNWTQGDLQLFTNEQQLAQASPGKVCQLVHDWFAAQLAIKDPDMQVRLLVDSLKPVVAG